MPRGTDYYLRHDEEKQTIQTIKNEWYEDPGYQMTDAIKKVITAICKTQIEEQAK